MQICPVYKRICERESLHIRIMQDSLFYVCGYSVFIEDNGCVKDSTRVYGKPRSHATYRYIKMKWHMLPPITNR